MPKEPLPEIQSFKGGHFKPMIDVAGEGCKKKRWTLYSYQKEDFTPVQLKSHSLKKRKDHILLSALLTNNLLPL